MKSKVKKQAEKDAARLSRATYRDGVPVEPVGIANDLGVQVLQRDVSEKTLGALVWSPSEEPTIFLNRRHSALRRRLTCAFELGYYVRKSAVTNEYERLDKLGGEPKAGEEVDHFYADEFAASLLMPKEDMKMMADLGMDDLEMALRLLVPREAVQLRLRRLGFPAPDLEAA
jgi:Zn-dependent peptidase ImmA (M78 family)